MVDGLTKNGFFKSQIINDESESNDASDTDDLNEDFYGTNN